MSFASPVRNTSRRIFLLVIGVAFITMLGGHACMAEDGEASEPVAEASSGPTDYETITLRGQVEWLAKVLERRFGIQTDDDAREAVVALETQEGRVYPIVKDARGRGFHKDARIRNIDVALRVRKFKGSPVVQVIRVYTIRDGEIFEFDYWCDICSIPMFELKECECCQGPIRFRERPRESTDPE